MRTPFKSRLFVICIPILILSCGSEEHLPELNSSSILSGKVFDQDGNALPQANVVVTFADEEWSDLVYGSATDLDGIYKLGIKMPAETLKIRIRYSARYFQADTIHLVITASDSLRINHTLQYQ